MFKKLPLVGFLCLVILLTVAQGAMAQATRTWVSGVGDDVNPCSRTAPCKTYAGAISKTAAHGTISTLDPGGFGAVTITKSITIEGTGTLGSILGAGSNGIIVNAAATDKVVLRDLSINGANTGVHGIRYLAGAQLSLENVNITGFNSSVSSRAIDVSLAGSGELTLKNVWISNCQNGVRLNTTAGQLLATLDDVSILNMALIGLEVAGGDSRVTVSRSTISHNNSDGIKLSGATSIANVLDSVLAFNNGAALNGSIIGSQMRLVNNQIVNNNVGITFVGGATPCRTNGHNIVEGNGSTGICNLTINEN